MHEHGTYLFYEIQLSKYRPSAYSNWTFIKYTELNTRWLMTYFICCHSKNTFKCFFSSLMCNSFSSIGMYFSWYLTLGYPKYIRDAEWTVERLFEEKEHNFTSCYIYVLPSLLSNVLPIEGTFSWIMIFAVYPVLIISVLHYYWQEKSLN